MRTYSAFHDLEMPSLLAIVCSSLSYLAGYLVVIFVGPYIVSYSLSRIQKNIEEDCSAEGVKGAGKAIGILERVLTLTFMYLNVPMAIALVLTAKSIVRFQDMKERHFAEYFLLGSLVSITFAVLTGALFSYIANFLLASIA